MEEKYNTVILAGGKCNWLKPVAETDILCLAKINSKSVLEYLIDALKASGKVKKIVVAAAEEIADKVDFPDVEFCSADIDMPSTAAKAAAVFGKQEKILFVCDDIPLLSSKAITDFLHQCEKYPQKQVFYPIIPKNACLKSYPEAQRTYGKLADGIFTGGNIMLVDYAVISKGLIKAREIYAKRKKPLELCRWLGFSFVIKMIFGRLTAIVAETRTSELLDMPCKVIISDFAELGMDVDKIEDWKLINKYLTK